MGRLWRTIPTIVWRARLQCLTGQELCNRVPSTPNDYLLNFIWRNQDNLNSTAVPVVDSLRLGQSNNMLACLAFVILAHLRQDIVVEQVVLFRSAYINSRRSSRKAASQNCCCSSFMIRVLKFKFLLVRVMMITTTTRSQDSA